MSAKHFIPMLGLFLALSTSADSFGLVGSCGDFFCGRSSGCRGSPVSCRLSFWAC